MIKIGLALSLIVAANSLNAANSDSLDDPTRPLINTQQVVEKKSSQSEVSKPTKKRNQLLAIIWDKKNNKAIIDEQTVMVGQTINGYRVHRIDKNKVVLRQGTKYKTLTMAPSVKVMKQQD